MAKKTVFRRLSKGLPLSPRTRDAIELDQNYDAIEATPSRIQAQAAVIGGEQGRAFSIETENEESEGPTEVTETIPEPQETPPEPPPVVVRRSADRHPPAFKRDRIHGRRPTARPQNRTAGRFESERARPGSGARTERRTQRLE